MTSSGMVNIEQILNAILTVPSEDPVKYFNSMYKSINPILIQEAVKDARRELQKENKKNGKPATVFMTLGAENMNRSLFTGAVGTALWLPEYLDGVAEQCGITKQELEITKKVLRAAKLPEVFDAKYDEGKDEFAESSSCRHYATFLGSLCTWLANGATAIQCRDKQRSNLELVKFLTSLALNSFPTIPFTAYFIGQIKTTDHMELAEKMSKVVDFRKYMSDKSIELNEPRFVVQNESAPLIGIANHPLSNMVMGMENNGKVEWFGLFTDSEEFEKLCRQHGTTVKDVKKYMYTTSDAEHTRNVAKQIPIAKFIESQPFTQELFAMRQKVFDITAGWTEDDEGQEKYNV